MTVISSSLVRLMVAMEKELSLGEKLGYALGDAAANFVLQMQIAFLMHFYTDVYGIAAPAVAALMGASRILDACNDLVMGALSDRTRTRWGKFRPWIFWTAIPLGVSSYLVFAAPDLGETGNIVYAAITLNLMIITYGANNIPYSALGGVISDDPDERVSVASWRFYFAMGTALIVLRYTLDMVERFGRGDAAHGYRVTMAIWASLAVVCSVTAFLTTRERVERIINQRASFLDDVRTLFGNPAWLALALASLLVYACLGVRGSVMLYYFEYALERKDLFGDFNTVGMIAAIAGIFMSRPLAERFGKRNVFCVGILLSAFLSIGFFWLEGGKTVSIMGLQLAYQAAFGATMPLLWGMIADVADLTEWQWGRRITALTFAATLFFFKIGQGVGTSLTAWLLHIVGYVPNVEQTETATYGIRMMNSFLPAALFLGSGIVILRYVITHQMEREMTAALRERRQALTIALE